MRAESAWPLRVRQTRAVFRLEASRSFSLRRGFWLALLAFAPIVIIGAHAIGDRNHRLDEEVLILAGIVQFFYVRLAIFFGCLGVFTRLVRGEVMERTLHYYLLAPVRRELVVVGKFLAGYAAVTLIFLLGVLASVLVMYMHFPAAREFFWHGAGLAHLRAYLLVTVLASLGYGAVFLLLGLVFRNPIIPGVLVLGWESINNVLPVFLKRLSVTYYLKPLYPVEMPIEGISGLFTVVAEPMAPWAAVTGLVVFAGIVVFLAARRIRRMEISYSTD